MKHYLSLLCIIKNEDYLEEFILYHYLLGVQHFFIYDNESTIPIKKRLNHYLYHKICTIIPYPGKVKQVEAYNHCIQHFRDKTEWLAIIDGDEFILPKIHENLIDFLKCYDNYRAIGINWINFGSNHYQQRQKGLLMKNYTKCESIQNPHIKTICKPAHVHKIVNPHYVNLHGGTSGYVDSKRREIQSKHYNEKYTIDIIQINHYWGKSYQEMKEKIDRGRATMNSKRTMPPNYHHLYNDREDFLILEKYYDDLMYLIEALKVHPHMYKLLNTDLENILGNDLNKYTIHLIDNGLQEKRPYKIQHVIPDFNIELYRNNYSDLNKLNDIELVKHYYEYGIKEERIYNKKMV